MHDECFEVTQKDLSLHVLLHVYISIDGYSNLLSEKKAHKLLGRYMYMYVGMLPQQNFNFRLSEITSGAFSDTYLTTKDVC